MSPVNLQEYERAKLRGIHLKRISLQWNNSHFYSYSVSVYSLVVDIRKAEIFRANTLHSFPNNTKLKLFYRNILVNIARSLKYI
jgi:hypothetical protein